MCEHQAILKMISLSSKNKPSLSLTTDHLLRHLRLTRWCFTLLVGLLVGLLVEWQQKYSFHLVKVTWK